MAISRHCGMMNARVIVVSDIDLTQITERDVLRAVNREPHGEISNICHKGVPIDRRPKVTRSRRKLAGSFKMLLGGEIGDSMWFTDGRIAFLGTSKMLKQGSAAYEPSKHSIESVVKHASILRKPWKPAGWSLINPYSLNLHQPVNTPCIWLQRHDGGYTIVDSKYYDFMTETLKVAHWEGSANSNPVVGKREDEVVGAVMAFACPPPPPEGIVRGL